VPAVPVVVRVAVPEDLPVLDRAIPTGRNDVHREFLRRQAAGDATYLVAWRDAEPVGYGAIRWGGRGEVPLPEISNLQVPAALQGQGIGTALVHFAEDLVRARGYAQVAIGVDEAGVRAAALYERLGYRDAGVRWTATYTWYDRAGATREDTEHVRVLALDL
jgi:ribosomal protein S18 acetylase RimI-like enzyme